MFDYLPVCVIPAVRLICFCHNGLNSGYCTLLHRSLSTYLALRYREGVVRVKREKGVVYPCPFVQYLTIPNRRVTLCH